MITEVKGTRGEGYRVQLHGFNDQTRVHILSSHLIPRFTAYSFLEAPEIPPLVINYNAYPNSYGDMEPVSDEFQYIGSRKEAPKFLGNMLQTPTLLQKRWTQSGSIKQRRPPLPDEEGSFMEEYARQEVVSKKAIHRSAVKTEFDSSNLEFLREPSKVFLNLEV